MLIAAIILLARQVLWRAPLSQQWAIHRFVQKHPPHSMATGTWSNLWSKLPVWMEKPVDEPPTGYEFIYDTELAQEIRGSDGAGWFLLNYDSMWLMLSTL